MKPPTILETGNNPTMLEISYCFFNILEVENGFLWRQTKLIFLLEPFSTEP